MKKKKHILYHADDYGISKSQSAHILECAKSGCLNSTSVFANSQNFDECARMLQPFRKKVRIGIHFNLVEGQCCANPLQIPLLVDEKGYFKQSFQKLLLLSLGSRKRELKNQISLELSEQLNKFLSYFKTDNETIRIDSHQHFHMIPIVFTVVLELLQKYELTASYLRIPLEPLGPYLSVPALYTKYKPINFVKHMLLNILSLWNRRLLKKRNIQGRHTIFFGVLITGEMKEDYVKKLLPYFMKKADKQHADLEVLFHPGTENNPAQCMDRDRAEFIQFHQSKNRMLEKVCMMRLKEWVK